MKRKKITVVLVLCCVLAGLVGCGLAVPNNTVPPATTVTVPTTQETPATTDPPTVPATTMPTETTEPFISFEPDPRPLTDEVIMEMVAEAENILANNELFRINYHLLVDLYNWGVNKRLVPWDDYDYRTRRDAYFRTLSYDGLGWGRLGGSEQALDKAEFILVKTTDDPELRYYQRFMVFLSILSEKYGDCILLHSVVHDCGVPFHEEFVYYAYVSSELRDVSLKPIHMNELYKYYTEGPKAFYNCYQIFVLGSPCISHEGQNEQYPGITIDRVKRTFDLSIYDLALESMKLPLYGLAAEQWHEKGVLDYIGIYEE